MTYRRFHDPHYKADRTAQKYNADKNKDRKSAAENAAFVEEFWENRKELPALEKEDPAAMFRAQREAVKRRKKLRREKQDTQRGKYKGKKKLDTARKAKANRGRMRSREKPSEVRSMRGSSRRYLDFSEVDLLNELTIVDARIDRWRDYHEASPDKKRRQVLAKRVQFQLDKRNDLIKILSQRIEE